MIDKSATGGSRAIAECDVDRVITMPWPVAVEASRTAALAQRQHDWVVFLHDDALLSPEAITFLHRRRFAADALERPLKHYVPGQFDPDTYYWPEHHLRVFRKAAVPSGSTVHGGVTSHGSDRTGRARDRHLHSSSVAAGRGTVDREDQLVCVAARSRAVRDGGRFDSVCPCAD